MSEMPLEVRDELCLMLLLLVEEGCETGDPELDDHSICWNVDLSGNLLQLKRLSFL